MQIIQFQTNDPAIATQVKTLILEQVNVWSRLAWLSDQPGYVTQPFGSEVFKSHPTITGLYWLDYDAIYANLGDSGRTIADLMVGQGVLLNKTLMAGMPELALVTVADPMAAGYEASP